MSRPICRAVSGAVLPVPCLCLTAQAAEGTRAAVRVAGSGACWGIITEWSKAAADPPTSVDSRLDSYSPPSRPPFCSPPTSRRWIHDWTSYSPPSRPPFCSPPTSRRWIHDWTATRHRLDHRSVLHRLHVGGFTTGQLLATVSTTVLLSTDFTSVEAGKWAMVAGSW